jgi:hypothetical protein
LEVLSCSVVFPKCKKRESVKFNHLSKVTLDGSFKIILFLALRVAIKQINFLLFNIRVTDTQVSIFAVIGGQR